MRKMLLFALMVCAGCGSDSSGPVSAGNDDQTTPPKLELPGNIKDK